MAEGKKNPPVLPGGKLEWALLTELWAQREATARDLFDQVGGPRGIVYTTVAKVLDRLVGKGLVRRRRSGRAYSYRAVASCEKTKRALAREMVEQLADGEPRPAIAALVGAIEDVSPELLEELETELRARRRHRDGT